MKYNKMRHAWITNDHLFLALRPYHSFPLFYRSPDCMLNPDPFYQTTMGYLFSFFFFFYTFGCSFHCLKQTCLFFKVYSFAHLFIHSNLFNNWGNVAGDSSNFYPIQGNASLPFFCHGHIYECTHIHTYGIHTQSSTSAPSINSRINRS